MLLYWACESGPGAKKEAGADADENDDGMVFALDFGEKKSGGTWETLETSSSDDCGVMSQGSDSFDGRDRGHASTVSLVEWMAQRKTSLLALKAHCEETSSILSVEGGRALPRDRAKWFAKCASDGVVDGADFCAGGDSTASLGKSSHPLCLQCDAIYRVRVRSKPACTRLCFGGIPDIGIAGIARTGTDVDSPRCPSPCAESATIQFL